MARRQACAGARSQPGRTAALRGSPPAGPDGLLDTLVEDVSRHTGGATADDMALLAVQRPQGA
ncbi:SpoIIE family protein phosphatase [Streptomyces sioyaensis]|uniref:SpoIIE family protein phosphatase n=1 Tax=Streptomyces sioyaensis TaxID=67364 RepID=UPI0036E7FAE1